MGNQLAAIAPSQIFPVEYYLTDLPEYQFDSSLGSTRFFKVAKAKFREGPVVVKVFAVHDPTLPLKTYRDQIEECDIKLENSPNCLSFKKTLSTEKAELLFRQYVKDNLYDRISTRPFLNNIERKWIAFQILCAVNQAHKAGVCHGDIKLENIMVTSWNWVLLTDFASYKPTYLPEDNPADFSYFFDTSRRRTCYVAPERFVKTLSADLCDNLSGTHYVLPDEDYRQGELTPAMDIFSTGCVLNELFTEGHAPFDFSQLLSYRNGDYSPSKAVDKIEDAHIKELVLHMMQKDPTKRLSAEIYLEMARGNVFPHYFYSFLYKYMQGFLMPSFVSPQDKINRLLKDLGNIVSNLKSSKEHSEKHVEGLVIIVSLVTSCLRAITQCSGKLQVLNVIQALVPNLSDELTLDRLLPYMLQALDDNFPQVRAAALEVLSRCLTLVKSVARSDANIFPEYVLPKLEQKAQDEAVMVRVTFAKNIAVLAETSLRFLELSQIRNQNVATDEESHTCFHTNYEIELQSLHEIIQQNVSTLLTDSDNIVKQTLLEFGITRLCIFFGRKKANDVVLSHMITVLNDKEDRHLRGAFFDSIVGVAAYIGWQCCPLIKPLLQQGFCDEEEFVTSKALHALSSLTELGLFQKHVLYELLVETCPFLCHPNIWIRNNTVGFICSAAKTMNIADIHCKLMPLVEPFLRHAVIQIDNEVVLLNQLIDPIPRPIFETVIRCRCIELLIDTFKQRQYLRKHGITSSSEPVGIVESVKQVFRRLLSDGMSVACEEQLLAMKESIIKQHKAKCRQEERQKSSSIIEGIVNLDSYKIQIRRLELRSADKVNEIDEIGIQEARIGGRKKLGNDASAGVLGMNEEWQHMFGSTDVRSQSPKNLEPHHQTQGPSFQRLANIEEASAENISKLRPLSHSIPRSHIGSTESDNFGVICRYADCKLDLDDLILLRRDHHMRNMLSKETIEKKARIRKQVPSDWKPKGVLVAHLHEHKAAVNRILVVPDTTFFATCSNDGTVKIWDCDRMERRSVSNRSRQTYSRPDCRFVSLEVCQSCQSLACASNSGSIHVFRLESSMAKITPSLTRMLDLQEEGCVVDMSYFDTGSQSVLTYATTYGLLVGWDLRAPGNAWKLENDPKHGLVTSYCIDDRHCWLAVGTSSGAHICWDLRFRLPISNIVHRTGARVRRMAYHPLQHSWVVSAVQGNNEVSVWDMETEACQITLWASPAPPLSQTESSSDSTLCFCMPVREGIQGIITAGSDSRIRFWDFRNPNENYVIVGSADDFINPTDVSYRSQIIDGAEVVKEIWNKPHLRNEDRPRRGPDTPPSGHLDCISDIAIHQTSQWLLLSASRDGVVKVWK